MGTGRSPGVAMNSVSTTTTSRQSFKFQLIGFTRDVSNGVLEPDELPHGTFVHWLK
jgi:hypothetical protein